MFVCSLQEFKRPDGSQRILATFTYRQHRPQSTIFLHLFHQVHQYILNTKGAMWTLLIPPYIFTHICEPRQVLMVKRTMTFRWNNLFFQFSVVSKVFFGLNIVFINASFYSASSLAGIVVIIRNRTSKIQVRIQHLTPYWITSLLRNSVQARGLSFSFDFFSLMKDTLQYQQGFEPITFKSRASVPTTRVHIKLFLNALGEKTCIQNSPNIL